MTVLRSIDPTTEQPLAQYSIHSEKEIDAAIERSVAAFRDNRSTSYDERAAKLIDLADALTRDCGRYAGLLTAEMGKTIREAEAEIQKCAGLCRYYAANAESFLNSRELDGDVDSSYVKHQPLGPILAVMPWNFPFWQVMRCCVPAIMAGNSILLKHASNVSGCALALEQLLSGADFSRGLFQTLLIESDSVARVLDDSRIAAASVTGSVGAGKSVAESAGRNLRKTVLELGGSDACIVMPSADIAQAARVGLQSRAQNNGQSCIAAKRFIIHAAVYNDFVDEYLDRLKDLKVGDPALPNTDVGPLAKRTSVERLEEQIERLCAEGAVRLAGAERRSGQGYFYSPGALANIPRGAPTAAEELFGPVAMFFPAENLRDAIAIANESPYGLASSIWTNEKTEVETAVDELEAGATFVNTLVRSDARWPFGGIRQSGYGRELSRQGILEFVNTKTVVAQGLVPGPARND